MFKDFLLLFLTSLQALLGNTVQIQNAAVNNVGESYVSRPVAEVSQTVNITDSVTDYSQKIAEMGITLHPGTDFTPDSKPIKGSEERCAALVYGTLRVMPEDLTKNIKDLTLYFSDEGRRGLGGGSTIILRCQNVTDEELVGVLVHELGHTLDTGVLKGNFWSGESEFHDGKNAIYNDDVSLDFYRISFENEKKLRDDYSDQDFVSGYAKTDPFEDFAESYNFYWLHGNEFRAMAEHNQALSDKYRFIKEKIFNNQEFSFDDGVEYGLNNSRNYDSTLLNYNLKSFLQFGKNLVK